LPIRLIAAGNALYLRFAAQSWKEAPLYCLIVLGSVMGGAIAAEIYLSYHAPRRLTLPFYNVLYPYVMFRPIESYSYETKETFAMSHFTSRVFVYTIDIGGAQSSCGAFGCSIVSVQSIRRLSTPG
jgi:hypothetical protein